MLAGLLEIIGEWLIEYLGHKFYHLQSGKDQPVIPTDCKPIRKTAEQDDLFAERKDNFN